MFRFRGTSDCVIFQPWFIEASIEAIQFGHFDLKDPIQIHFIVHANLQVPTFDMLCFKTDTTEKYRQLPTARLYNIKAKPT